MGRGEEFRETTIPGVVARLVLETPLVYSGEEGTGSILLRNIGDAVAEWRWVETAWASVLDRATNERLFHPAPHLGGERTYRLNPGDETSIPLRFRTTRNQVNEKGPIGPGVFDVEASVGTIHGRRPGRGRTWSGRRLPLAEVRTLVARSES